jgi:hypothetical protein
VTQKRPPLSETSAKPKLSLIVARVSFNSRTAAEVEREAARTGGGGRFGGMAIVVVGMR